MVEVIASKLLFSFIESQDKLDTIGRVFGHDSKEFSEALEKHSELHFELRDLIALGLAEKEKSDCNGNV